MIRLFAQAPSAIHEARFLKFHKAKMTLAEIAQEEGKSTITIERSIQMVQAYRARADLEAVQTAQGAVVVDCSEDEKHALRTALRAKTPVVGKKGTIIKEVPDHETRLKASQILTDKLTALQPRGGGTRVNVGVGINNPSPVSSSFSFEDRLREIRKNRQLPAAPAEVVSEALSADSEEGQVSQ